jgi:predicted molibdopterin-dependent oxidoreductase YjgC
LEEITRVTPIYGGITYERLEQRRLQWPCPSKDHPGTQTLHTNGFPRGKGKFVPVRYKPPIEIPDSEYPFTLTTERSQYHFHTGTLTRRIADLNKILGEGFVEINPGDAKELNLRDGETVKIVSRRGSVVTRVKLSRASPPGVVTMNFHFAECPVNEITNPAVDPVAKIQELKVAAVRIERVFNCIHSSEGDWMQLTHPGKITITHALYSKYLSQKAKGRVIENPRLITKPDSATYR